MGLVRESRFTCCVNGRQATEATLHFFLTMRLARKHFQRMWLVSFLPARPCPKSRSIDCWERGRPVRTEREARKALFVFNTAITSVGTGCGRNVRVPSIDPPRASWTTFWAKPKRKPPATLPRHMFAELIHSC